MTACGSIAFGHVSRWLLFFRKVRVTARRAAEQALGADSPVSSSLTVVAWASRSSAAFGGFFDEFMKRFFTILVMLTVTLTVVAHNQQSGDQIEVTGIVKSYCQHGDGAYRFNIQLHVKNLSNNALIIAKAHAFVSSYVLRKRWVHNHYQRSAYRLGL